jgi:tRNA threonylcarbamoyladenosine biosynthesis protein TsaB
MLTLAIESSGKTASIALGWGDDALWERTISDVGRRHAQTLVHEIENLLTAHDCTLESDSLIAVSIGPGSFTGLRVGVVCAKALAYVAGSRLAAVDTFEAIAANSPDDVREVHVVADAQRGGLFVGWYTRGSAGNWTRHGALEIVDAEAWTRSRTESDVLTGPGVERIAMFLPAAKVVLPEKCWTPTAAAVARIGHRLCGAGKLADCFRLEPFYLRASAAEEKAAQEIHA